MLENSLTKELDSKLSSLEEIDAFIDNLEEDIFGVSAREFYLIYKGDIKELISEYEELLFNSSYESELLAAFTVYRNQRFPSSKP